MNTISFVFPGFLWALTLVLLPIIVHLFAFRKYKLVYFSDINLLKKITQTGKSKKQIKHWLILLLRCLMILFLVLAFSQPIQTNKLSSNSSKKLICIYIDNSFSMGNSSRNGELLSQAKVFADQIIKSYGENDRFQIISNHYLPQDQYLQYKENAQNLVANIEIDFKTLTVDEIYKRQLNFLNKNKDYSAVIYWLSDFQHIPDSNQFSKTDVAINFVPIISDETSNVSIDSLWFNSPVRSVSGKDEVWARVFNHGDKSLKNYTISLDINGEVQVGNLQLPPKSFTDINFTYAVPKSKNIIGKFFINDQAVKFDNELCFSYKVPKTIKVLVVTENNDFTKIVRKIFSNDSLVDLKFVSPFQVDFSSLASCQLIIVGQLNEIESGLSNALTSYLSDNNVRIAVFPSSNIAIEKYNYLGSKLNSFRFVAKDTVDQDLMPIESNISFFKGVFEESKTDKFVKIKMPKLFNHYTLKGLGDGVENIVKKKNELPYLISSNGVYVFSSGITKDCSNFSQHSLIVPLFYQLVYASVLSNQVYNVLGSTVQIPIESNWQRPIEIISPNRNKFSGKISGNFKSGDLLVDANFNQQGCYGLKLKDNNIAYLAFNYNRKESFVEENSDKKIKKLCDNNSNFKLIPAIENQLEKHISHQINGIDYWQECLMLSILFLILEMIVIRKR